MYQHGLRCKGIFELREVHNDENRDVSGTDTVGLNVGKQVESWHFLNDAAEMLIFLKKCCREVM
jgi:hypothetical protein